MQSMSCSIAAYLALSADGSGLVPAVPIYLAFLRLRSADVIAIANEGAHDSGEEPVAAATARHGRARLVMGGP